MRARRDGVSLEGFAGLPTLHRPNSLQLYLAVNGRPVRDKLLAGTARAAYGDLVPQGRYPMLALFLTLPPQEVDVNVHPAKTELRFRDPNGIRSLIIGALRETLGAAGHRATSSSVASRPAAHGDAAERTAERQYRPLQPQSGGRSVFGLSEAAQAPLGPLAEPSADTRGTSRQTMRQPRSIRSARRERRFTTPSSSPRPRMLWLSSISTPRMSASSMSA